MPQRSDRVRTLAAIAAFVLTSGVSYGSTGLPIVIRVYDAAGGSATVRAAAIGTAARIIGGAGIDADWRDCTADGAQSRCQAGDRTRDLIVRIMPALRSGTSFRGSSLQVRTTPGAPQLPLGVAVIDPHTLTGEMATIYQAQVLTVARRTGLAGAELLGRTLAHEVGHLLLRAPGHSPTGLMRAVWSDEELSGNRPEDWVFAVPDLLRLQSRVTPDAPQR